MLRLFFKAMRVSHTPASPTVQDPEVLYNLDTFAGIVAFYRSHDRSIGQ